MYLASLIKGWGWWGYAKLKTKIGLLAPPCTSLNFLKPPYTSLNLLKPP